MQRKLDETAAKEKQGVQGTRLGTPSATAPEKKSEGAQEILNEEEKEPYSPRRSLIETLNVRLVTYDGDRYLFSLGITSEFDKCADYDRGTFHDAQFEYLLEKAREFRDKLDSSALYTKTPEVSTSGKQGGEWSHIDRGDKLYARVMERPNELVILPVESLQIKSDDWIFQKFLIPKVLQKMKDNRGLDYKLESRDDILQAITIKGNIDHDLRKKLLSPIGWALERASTREAEPKAEKAEGDAEIEKIKALFSADLLELLSFERVPEWILLRPNRFLGAENFAKIASIVRENGGEYISAGKESHFRVPLKK